MLTCSNTPIVIGTIMVPIRRLLKTDSCQQSCISVCDSYRGYKNIRQLIIIIFTSEIVVRFQKWLIVGSRLKKRRARVSGTSKWLKFYSDVNVDSMELLTWLYSNRF